jgi:exodeoxyribonuclease V alpha subunit
MNLDDEVADIVFRNEENGYSVLRLLNTNTMATGVFPYVAVGQELSLVGDFVQNAKYGKQFAVKSYQLIPPNSPAKIRAFIGSGLIEGVGPVTAENIVKAFGRDTLQILEKEPHRLDIVKGISPRKAKIIGERYAEISQMQSSIVFLQKFEISMNMAIKIYNHYKESTQEQVQTNPYALIETIDGIGFLTADKMAKDIGIDYAGAFRVRAGVVYVLKQSAEQDGDTYLPIEKLRLGVCRLLKIKMEQLTNVFDRVVKELCMDKYLTAVPDGVMLTKFYVAEKAVAGRIALLNTVNSVDNVGSENNDDGINELLINYQKVNKISLHAKQIDAIKMAVGCGISVITGGPGTGKTTIVRAILHLADTDNQSVMLLAPTGRAAKRLEETTGHTASTIHRALDIDYKGGRGVFMYDDPDNIICADVVIVDEVSMCDCILMSQLLKKVPNNTRIVLVGDIDQLPSVGAGNVLADIIKSRTVPVTALTEIYRQSDTSTITTNAHAINAGEMPLLDNKSTDFFFARCESSAEIKQKVVALATERLPKHLNIQSSQIQILSPMKVGEAGMNSLNLALQESINPSSLNKSEYEFGHTTFRVGDRVMQTVNNYQQEWTKAVYNVECTMYNEGEIKSGAAESGSGIYNGDIGVITAINRQSGEIAVELEDGRTTTYTRADLNNLVLAYAITVHKSQGCEFEVVIVPVTGGVYMIMTRNLLYTAVTRAKTMVVLVGSAENIQKMVENTYTKKRHTMLCDLLVSEGEKAERIFS